MTFMVNPGTSSPCLSWKSKELPWETIDSHVNHMMLHLQYSGYDQKFRTEVVRSVMKAYNRLIELDTSGEQPLYRPREWKRLERAQERREKPEKWYRKGSFDMVIFMPATPESQLKDRYVKETKRAGFKIRVLSRAVRCNPQADVTEVIPVQRQTVQQHQLSSLQHWRKRILPQYQCYLWAGLSSLLSYIHWGDIQECLHLW